MKILLSPAKSLNYETKPVVTEFTTPLFKDQAVQLNKGLKKLSRKKLSELMSISDKLADLNYDRNQEFTIDFNQENSKQAIYAFDGDVYTGLDAYTLSESQIKKAQKSIRILSGLYGYLRPLDLMQPYRLEMGTKWSIGGNDNLYQYWKDVVTPALNEEMTEDELVVNLASNEYFKVINKKALTGKLISPVFKDYKNGKLKVISFFAKKARGAMARHLITTENRGKEAILSFATDGYSFSAEETKKENEPVFVR
ncbi:peroxide stress protein YaaA [Nonlabens tegetincola]|uniref:peroxide stress protein YaaA n=1 Tax=Nonlabens tegetincola TaxID=323273 RepID=UPI000CF4811E|nr:peroxide stress protein YaaA [Nonlabens tegetincola]PQJ19320.1 hypothetical protein BST93_06080 [Nonlabens tegetincola]